MPDEKYGEDLMAGSSARASSPHQSSRYVHVVDGFPMTVTGKMRGGSAPLLGPDP
ncbi:hypothetical protein ACIBEJ_25145 [Nonomuraea sp. NPDC050790]|uniref:hypothetical protein n=1 Tax=Nonomuraea sp. NPDC050790 TaxID=3364371 RepID=UPI0037A7E422